MTKRRSTWLGASGALFLILSLSGVAAGATPPDAVPDVVVDTTATFEDIDGNGIDDDCQDVDAVADEDAAAAELLTVDTDGDGVISTTEAAHSPRIGGKNCNHGGYVSWIAHQEVTCEDEPTEPVIEPVVELIVAADEDQDEDTGDEIAEPEADACAGADESDAEAVKTEKAAAAALRAVLKAERTLVRETAKAERTAARDAAKTERTSARDAKKAERAAAHAAAKAERAAAKAARTKKGH